MPLFVRVVVALWALHWERLTGCLGPIPGGRWGEGRNHTKAKEAAH